MGFLSTSQWNLSVLVCFSGRLSPDGNEVSHKTSRVITFLFSKKKKTTYFSEFPMFLLITLVLGLFLSVRHLLVSWLATFGSFSHCGTMNGISSQKHVRTELERVFPEEEYRTAMNTENKKEKSNKWEMKKDTLHKWRI